MSAFTPYSKAIRVVIRKDNIMANSFTDAIMIRENTYKAKPREKEDKILSKSIFPDPSSESICLKFSFNNEPSIGGAGTSSLPPLMKVPRSGKYADAYNKYMNGPPAKRFKFC